MLFVDVAKGLSAEDVQGHKHYVSDAHIELKQAFINNTTSGIVRILDEWAQPWMLLYFLPISRCSLAATRLTRQIV